MHYKGLSDINGAGLHTCQRGGKMTKEQELKLKRFQTKGFENARSISIYCAEGSLWITAGNNLGDCVLYAGKELHIIASKKVVVEALSDSITFVSVNSEAAEIPHMIAATENNI